MNPEITKIIEQYLANELSPSDKIAFEKKLAENKSLQDEVIRQQNIHAAAKRASKRTEIQQIGKSYHFFKKVLTTGIVVAVIVVVSSLGYLAYKMTSNSEADFSQSEEVKALIEKLKKESPIDELASEFFFWEGKDSVLLSNEGVLLSVPENAFLLKGKPYNEKAIIQWQEAMDPATIVKSGLSTMAGDRLLETQGMFGVQAYTKDGQKLTVNPKVGVYVQVPVDQYKSGMQLFTGAKGKDSIIDWKNPKPLQKIPVPIDMKELDFYPKGYENTLNEMKKSKKKAYRDSLYLSFDEVGEYLPEPENTDSTASIDFFDYDEEIKIIPTSTNKVSSSDGKALFQAKCAVCHQPHKDGTGPKLFQVRSKWEEGGAKPGSIYKWVQNWQEAMRVDDYAKNVEKLTPGSMQLFPELKKEDIDAIFDYIDAIPATSEFISPTKVMAFWKPQFNKTLLATREFERRMQSIHTTCDNKVLDLYTSNLSKSMQEIDEMAVSMGYPAFSEFAKEQIGALKESH